MRELPAALTAGCLIFITGTAISIALPQSWPPATRVLIGLGGGIAVGWTFIDAVRSPLDKRRGMWTRTGAAIAVAVAIIGVGLMSRH